MSKYFVYYEDDWFDCGGVGFKDFESAEEALNWIQGRDKDTGLEQRYRLIEGKELKFKPKEFVTKLVVDYD